MAKQSEIKVKSAIIKTMRKNGMDFISITDIAKQKNETDPNGVIANWMRNRNTIEFLGIWETLYNPNFNPLEFDGFRTAAGLNAFTLSPTRWIEATRAIGIVSQSGRYGGTYACSDIAFLCDEPIDPANIDQRPNFMSFDNGDAGTINMPQQINIYVRKDVKNQYDAIPFYNNFNSIQPSFVEDGNEYLQVAARVADLLSVKSENYTFVVPEKTESGLEVGLIGDYAFQTASNKIKEVVIKNNIEYVGAQAFMTDIENNTSTIENVFFISNAPSKKMLSTTRFELDETGTNYKEFASTTNIYVKKSVADIYKNEWKKLRWDTATGTMQDSPAEYQFYNQIDYRIPDVSIKTKYGTFAREFDTDFSDYFTTLGKSEVAAFVAGSPIKVGNGDYGTSTHKVTMTSIDENGGVEGNYGYIPAYTGVLLKVLDKVETDVDFYYTIGEKDDVSYDITNNIMNECTVNYKEVFASEDDPIYVMQGGVFRKATAPITKFPVHKAYMKPGTIGAGAKIMFVFDDEETVTSLDEIIASDVRKDSNDYYNLNGQRVENPQQGIYIKNGKKIVIK